MNIDNYKYLMGLVDDLARIINQEIDVEYNKYLSFATTELDKARDQLIAFGIYNGHVDPKTEKIIGD